MKSPNHRFGADAGFTLELGSQAFLPSTAQNDRSPVHN